MNATQKQNKEAALDSELAFHIAELTDSYIAQGYSAAEARRRALVDFGGPTQIKQTVRELYLTRWFDVARFYLRAVLRYLRHSPGFSLAVIGTLALGIGANSAIFSVLDAVVLRPLPYPASGQLQLIAQHNIRNQDSNTFVAPVRLEDWNRLSGSFEAISGTYKDDLTETSGNLPERLTEAMVAPRFFTVMGVAPMLGRTFLPAEEHFGGPRAVLISYRLWRRRFNADPGVLGRQLHVGHASLPIVGVMPPLFLYPDREVDVWEPSPPDAPFARSRESTWYAAIGRLKPGITPQTGQANLNAVQRQLGLAFPKPDASLRVETTPFKEAVVGGVRQSLWLLYGSVSLLLLLACSNIAGLLLARTAEREHEISVRFSLGASRGVLIAQLLAEVFALALLGSALGLCLAAGVLHIFHQVAAGLPRTEEITLNWRVALYSLACASGTTLLCGMYPAWRGTRRQLARSLAAGGRTQTGARGTLQWWLVGTQIGLAVILLTGAGLLVRSLLALGSVSTGFDPDHVLSFQLTGSYGETADMGRLVQRINTDLDALRSLPGVEAAATSVFLPGLPATYQLEYKRDGHAKEGQPILADGRMVSDGYFKALEIAVLQGQSCDPSGSAPVNATQYVVNRSFAERYFANGTPLGHTLQPAASAQISPPGRIVGIVADAREQGLDQAPLPTVYTCFNASSPAPHFLLRTRGNPKSMIAAVQQRMRQKEPQRSVYAAMPLRAHLDDAFSDDRLRTGVLVSFAAIAVLLACIGLYGTVSYLTRLREREVGVRLVLGASRIQVASLFLRQGGLVVACGCAAGMVASVLFSRLLATMLFGVSPLDLATYSTVLLVTFTLAALACLLPARRAALLEPTQALRNS